MNAPLVVGINGSPFKDGIVNKLLDSALEGARLEGAEIATIHLCDLQIGYEKGSYSKDPAVIDDSANDDFTALLPRLLRADAFVFATPVYWANMSGAMKTFIDRMIYLENNGSRLEGKPAAFIAASKENEGGLEMAVMSMVAAVTQMGVLIPANSILWYPGDWTTTSGTMKNWAEQFAPLAGRNLVKISRILETSDIKWLPNEIN